jgi:transposase
VSPITSRVCLISKSAWQLWVKLGVRFSGLEWLNLGRELSRLIFVIRNGLRWRDAPAAYGPHKTIYNRFIRWSRLGVFNRIFAELAAKGGKPDQLMIDATHLKAHRTAASLLKKGLYPDVSGAPKAG